MRIGVVLSAGGLRGAAHAEVLQQLVRHGVPLHTIVGVGAGAIVRRLLRGGRAGDTRVEATELKDTAYQQVLLRELEAAVH